MLRLTGIPAGLSGDRPQVPRETGRIPKPRAVSTGPLEIHSVHPEADGADMECCDHKTGETLERGAEGSKENSPTGLSPVRPHQGLCLLQL